MKVIVDTSAMVALLDADADGHDDLRDAYEQNPSQWILPAAILPEVDYLVTKYLGTRAQTALLADLVNGSLAVEWGCDADLAVAHRLCRRFESLRLGLVDALVIATAERLGASAIATLDLRHFGAVPIKGSPRLLPRDS